MLTPQFSKKEKYKSGQKALTVTQVPHLLSVIINLQDDALLRLAISGGIRRYDIVNILDSNVNFKENYVEFAEKKKHGKIKRVYCSQEVMNTLAKWMQLKKKGNPYLFPGRGKKPLSDKTAYNILQANLKRAGLPSIPFHALRATSYKLAKAKGWSPREAAEHIGDSTRVAEEHYGTPSTEEMKSKAMNNPII